MKVENIINLIKQLGIETVVGVPDSTLKVFCDYLNSHIDKSIEHYVPANEGAAAAIAVGSYLASGKPACVYMQNSGLGNFINPFTSLMHEEVYQIPVLMVVGWRGEPGLHDEPQHKFMGEITIPLLQVLDIPYGIIDKETDEELLKAMFDKAQKQLMSGKAYCIVVKRGSLEEYNFGKYQNDNVLNREEVISELLKKIGDKDIVVSTTGKISREIYEQSNLIKGQHSQEFLTVGGMGHASMIAFGIAKKMPERKVICIDGDGAVLMHMGSMAFIGKQNPNNFIHICLNNDAHESVGGMPTGAAGARYYDMADKCGYKYTACIESRQQLENFLETYDELAGPAFIEMKISMDSRKDLGRPKETARENKIKFMEYHEV